MSRYTAAQWLAPFSGSGTQTFYADGPGAEALPACKNIGATYVTNGCFRLHPNEWSTGEAAGHLAAFCLDHGVRPRAVRADAELVAGLQRRLERDGVELERPHWQPSMSCHRYRVDQPGLVLGRVGAGGHRDN